MSMQLRFKARLLGAGIKRRLRNPQKYKTLGFLCDYLAGEDVVVNESARGRHNKVISQICTILSRYIPRNCACLVYRNPIYQETDLTGYADMAMKKGAAVLITDRAYKNYPCIISDNPLGIYAKLCRYYRDLQKKVSVTVVTGSIGKSTVTSMISHVFKTKARTASTEVNANSLKSVGFIAQHIPDDVELMVHEIAESEPGETKYLTEILHPDIFVITAIDASHLEHFGTVDKIVEEICSATRNLSEDGVVVVNKDEFHRYDLLNGRKAVTVSASDSGADFSAEEVTWDEKGLSFKVKVAGENALFPVSLPGLLASHNVVCALQAFAAGWHAGVAPESIAKGLASYRTKGVRQHLLKTESGVVVFADCYNAVGRSIKSAVDTCARIPVKGKRVAVLGNVEEVGDISDAMHEEIVSYVNDSNFDVLVAFGDKMIKAAESGTFRDSLRVRCCGTAGDLAAFVQSVAGKDDLFLFKSSHSCHLEECIMQVWPELKTEIVGQGSESYNGWMMKSLSW